MCGVDSAGTPPPGGARAPAGRGWPRQKKEGPRCGLAVLARGLAGGGSGGEGGSEVTPASPWGRAGDSEALAARPTCSPQARAAPAPAPIIDPCPEGYVLKDGACVLAETDPLGGFPSLTPRLPQGPTVVGNPGYTPVGGGVAPRLNPYPQQMPIMAPPPGLAGARVGEAGILDLLRAANR